MLSRLVIQNFRSIKHLDIPLSPINMFVGPNNAGKTNILEALNLILGETYPSVRSFDDRDHYMKNADAPICITAFLDQPLVVQDVFRNEHEAWGYQIQLSRYQRRTGRAQAGDPKFDYTMVDANGSELEIIQRHAPTGRRPFPEPMRVSNDLRDRFPLLFVGIDRSITAQLRGYQRTFMGRILRELDKDFRKDSGRVADFAEKMSEATKVLRTETFHGFEQNFRDQVGSLTGLTDLSLGFRAFDPVDHYRLLELYVREITDGLEFLPDELGSGTQSALAVALIRAYAQIVKQGAALVIEEPELYLHPHSCRFFKHSLQELSDDGVQVFCSTHSPSFVDLGSYDSLHIVSRAPGKDTKISCGKNLTLAAGERQRLHLQCRFDTSRNEIFFARRVMLVEGPGERSAFKTIPELLSVNFDQEGISVIDTDGKPGMAPVSKVLREFGIPHVCLVDDDAGKPTGERLTEEIKDSCGADNLFVMTPDFEGEVGATTKLRPVDAMELFMSYSDPSQVPEVMRSATQKVLSL